MENSRLFILLISDYVCSENCGTLCCAYTGSTAKSFIKYYFLLSTNMLINSNTNTSEKCTSTKSILG